MIELLACKLGRNDEVPNIELAERLCATEDRDGIREIAKGLESKDNAVVNDCIKVLYEIGQRKPDLIADLADVFISGLSNKNNRLVWGCMTALACSTPINPNVVFDRLPEVIAAYKKGSIITIDNSISVFAWLCAASEDYQQAVFPLLLEHIANCRAKEIPQHSERMAVCIDSGNKDSFFRALDARYSELSDAQKSRLNKLKRTL